MIKIYTDEEYSKSYTELIEILKYFSKSDLEKIPHKTVLRYIEYKDNNYDFSYNPDLDIDEQNVSKLTLILLANLYIEYFADEDERNYIKNKDLEYLAKLEKEKQEKYDITSIFNKRKEKYINENDAEITNLPIVSNKTNIVKRIFEKIKKFLKLT